ncbi:iron ABC transporter permease [Permianibacter sp. IMCC34836]|uniref:FecCD family ABC transporter permease n=1 Tax=Permianibacter fluminis TaxID=2738515 RepID=UPI0015558B95|nr:iron ABC transporter permease [Permianibacter fluminis]NQD38571.1 iron ABC transporter permease [Permianibacter fluminis]
MKANNRRWLPALLLVAIALLLLLSMSIGSVALPWSELLSQLWHGHESVNTIIVTEIRLPRALLAAAVGAVLGLSGAALQGLFRNPLAESGLVGVSSCASLGAVIALYYGFSQFAWWVMPGFGMAGALLAVLALFVLAGRGSSITGLLLAGVAINAFAGACIALALNFAPNPYAMSEMVYWLLGSFSNRTLNELLFALPFLLLGSVLVWRQRRFLDALSLGEETAQTLGFSLPRSRLLLVMGIAASVGAAVAVSGSIGFVGLLVPHLMRPLVGHQPGRLLSLSALAGAVLLLIADICVQLVARFSAITGGATAELKIGVVTALFGAPFFLLLIVRLRHRTT